MFVRFKDIRDPKSVEAVDPAAIGVKRIWVEVTSDPVTTGIENRLGWIDHLDRYRTDPTNPFTANLPSEINGLRNK